MGLPYVTVAAYREISDLCLQSRMVFTWLWVCALAITTKPHDAFGIMTANQEAVAVLAFVPGNIVYAFYLLLDFDIFIMSVLFWQGCNASLSLTTGGCHVAANNHFILVAFFI
mmetsp:Transcript_30515/g.67057  ORF Transcript_30515/g.67057 Transcript_30515/m.67057 type:complete len:113 (+) Transcript_30515:1527-1865(+)